jgi:DNA-binding NarL/FixJ family response regulator
MSNVQRTLLLVEHSEVIGEGINTLFYGNGNKYKVCISKDIDNLSVLVAHHAPHVVIINPQQVLNRVKAFKALKSKFHNVIWIALLYIHFEKEILELFDDFYSIGMPGAELLKLADKYNSGSIGPSMFIQDVLSERETDVLVLLAQGNSNKAIADQLNISIHTVISHRKSISNKTGIRSQAGLTIYAISNKIVSLESLAK